METREKQTIDLITRSFDRAMRGGFTDGDTGQWVSYQCKTHKEMRMSLPQAARILGLEPVRTVQFKDIKEIEQAYYDLYSTWDPARYNVEEQPEQWKAAVQRTDLLTQAYERIVMAKMLQGRKITSLDYRRIPLAERVLSRLVKFDKARLAQGELHIIWNRDALKAYGIPRNVIEIGYDTEGNLQLITIVGTIAKWIDELYRKPYADQGYELKVTIEDWPEEFS
jgi:hypothetical protein